MKFYNPHNKPIIEIVTKHEIALSFQQFHANTLELLPAWILFCDDQLCQIQVCLNIACYNHTFEILAGIWT